MSRIAHAFSKGARIAYLTAGDPNVSQSIAYFLALAKAGATVLEVGVPFSDPIADGVVIQQAMTRALRSGTDLAAVIQIIQAIRLETDVAIVVFTYLNPILDALDTFLKALKEAGADGILVVDLPLEECDAIAQACDAIGLSLIAVAAPATPLQRITALSRRGSGGFLYYACRQGTTGMRSDLLPASQIQHIRAITEQATCPVAVGFGISSAQMVRQVLSVAAGCVVGSYFVEAIAQGDSPEQLARRAQEIFYVD